MTDPLADLKPRRIADQMPDWAWSAPCAPETAAIMEMMTQTEKTLHELCVVARTTMDVALWHWEAFPGTAKEMLCFYLRHGHFPGEGPDDDREGNRMDMEFNEIIFMEERPSTDDDYRRENAELRALERFLDDKEAFLAGDASAARLVGRRVPEAVEERARELLRSWRWKGVRDETPAGDDDA